MLRVGLAALLAVAGAWAEEVTVKTPDGWELPATLWKGKGETGVVLVHMMDRSHDDWKGFGGKLAERGYTALSFDLRGHGGSKREGKAVSWREFDPSGFVGMVEDVLCALQYVQAIPGVKKVWLVGASIGANASLHVAVKEKGVRGLVLLSPGFDYRGLKTEEALKEYDRPVLFAASRNDAQSWNDTSRLFDEAKGQKDFAQFDASGHGTTMLEKSPELADRILKFLGEH